MGCSASKQSRVFVPVKHKQPKSRKSSSSSSSSSSKSNKKEKNSKKNKHVQENLSSQNQVFRDSFQTKEYPTLPKVQESISITLETLQSYISMESTISILHSQNVISKHNSIKQEYDSVCKHIDQLNDSPPSPGDDYDTALENHNRILISLNEQKTHLEQQIVILVGKMTTLQNTMDNRDDLLEKIFGGTYGSSLEDQLEEEFIRAANKEGHVSAFYQHWNAAISYTKKSFEQMNTGYQYWQKSYPGNFPNEIKMIASGAAIINHMTLVTNARSWFLASSTNLSTAVRICLETLKVTIPYCNPPELDTLNKAIHHIFIDSKTVQRHVHAGKVFYSMGTRAGGLLKWLENTLQKFIIKDYEKAKEYTEKCRKALYNERKRLIRKQVENKLGLEVLQNFDNEMAKIEEPPSIAVSQEKANEDLNMNRLLSEVDTNLPQVTELPKVSTTETVTVQTTTTTTTSIETEQESEKSEIKAIDLKDLAPQPTRAMVYGQMFALMEDHQDNVDKLQEIEDKTKDNRNKALKEKLSMRRRRKVD